MKKIDKYALIGKQVKVRKGKKEYNGEILGRQLDFPVVVCKETGEHWEITWDLAYRAVYEHTIIVI